MICRIKNHAVRRTILVVGLLPIIVIEMLYAGARGAFECFLALPSAVEHAWRSE